jgi:addiction module RelB/DinJ family antitoxin
MNVQVSARVPEEIRDEAEKVANRYGLTASDILKMTLTVVANEHRVPIEISKPIDLRNDLSIKLWDKAVDILPANMNFQEDDHYD